MASNARRTRVALLREPYLGLACRVSLVHPCRKLGLAVWLPRDADAVTAYVDRRSVSLSTREQDRAERGPTLWQGFSRDGRAERDCEQYPHALAVDIHVSARNGDELAASGRVVVSCGDG